MLLPFTKNKYYFKPGILLTLFFICVIVLLYSLGVWQLERADEKKVLAAQIEQRLSQQTMILNDTNIEQLIRPDIAHRTITLNGKFDTREQFFIDNKKYNGRAGYHVITPFNIDNTQQTILVNRGWVDSGGNRNILPEVVTPSELITLEGRLSNPVTAHFRPGISQPAESLGGIWLYIDLDFFSGLSGTPVAPYILLLNKENQYGYVREWPEFKANTEMHVGYAIQWFTFALFSLLAYLSIGTKKRLNKD